MEAIMNLQRAFLTVAHTFTSVVISTQFAFAQTSDTGIVEGQVRVIGSDKVENVLILAQGDSVGNAWANEDGRFFLTLRQGKWKLTAFKDGYIQVNTPRPAIAEATFVKNRKPTAPRVIELGLQRR